LNLWLVIEYTVNRNYYRLISDSQESAEKHRYARQATINYDEHGEMFIGAVLLGPFTLNEITENIYVIPIVEEKQKIDTYEEIEKKKEIIAGDFKIAGSTVILQDPNAIKTIIRRIDKAVNDVIDRDAQMKADLKKLNLPMATIEAMIAASKKEEPKS
jgi:hypothetical protein